MNDTNEKWRTLIEDMPIGVMLIDCNRKIRDINKSAVDMIGRGKDEILGRVCHEFVCPMRENDCPVYDHGKTLDRAEAVLLSKDLGGFAIEKTVTKIVVDGEEMLLEMFSDITRRKHAEKLSLIQRDLALAINATTGMDAALRICVDAALKSTEMDCGGVYLIDDDSGAMDLVFHRGLPADFVNSASHYDSDSDNVRLIMAGKPIYSRHQELGARTDEVRRQEHLRAIAVIPVWHDDRVIACLNIASHTMDEVPAFVKRALETVAAQIGGAIARIKLDDALLRERDRAKQYLDVAGVILIIIDPDRRARRINRKGCKILGCGEEDILGKDWFDNFIPERVRNETIDAFEAFVRGGNGGSNPVEYHENPVLTKKDGGGERIIAWHNAALHDKNGKITGVLSSGEDITRRRELEQQLQQAFDRLKASYEELSIPVIQVHDSVLAIPIMGFLDDMRINQLTETMLHRIADMKSKVVILDLTAIRSIDSAVANRLLETVAAARLLGAECILTGIGPEVAAATVRLGLDEMNVVTRGSLQEGLAYAMQRVGGGGRGRGGLRR